VADIPYKHRDYLDASDLAAMHGETVSPERPAEYRVRMKDGRTILVPDLTGKLSPEGRDLYVTDNPNMESDMDMAGNYETPFAPATASGATCICVCCGAQGAANKEISQYPFRYIPKGWSVNAQNRALRCDRCVREQKTDPSFVAANDVWVDYPEPQYRGDSAAVQVTVRHHHSPLRREIPHRVAQPTLQDAYDQENEIAMPDTEEIQEVPETRREAARRLGHETRTDRMKRQAKQVGGAVGQGLALAAANEAGEVFVDIAKELTSELPMMQLALEHPDGREVAKVLVALMLHTATEQTNVIPQGEFIGEACKLQMTASTFTLVGPRLNRVRKHLTKLAKIGEQTSTGVVRARVETEDEESYAELEAELEAMKAQLAEMKAEKAKAEPAPKKKRASRKAS
jgi:hypothetical protein